MDVENARYLVSAVIQATAIAYGVLLAMYVYFYRRYFESFFLDEEVESCDFFLYLSKRIIRPLLAMGILSTATIIFGIVTLCLDLNQFLVISFVVLSMAEFLGLMILLGHMFRTLPVDLLDEETGRWITRKLREKSKKFVERIKKEFEEECGENLKEMPE